jgi:hypothetical protein
MSQGRDVSPALNHSDIVFVAEKQKRSKAKRQRLNISQEHKQRIREKVRAECHQYLPRASPVHRAQRRPVRWAARQRRGSIQARKDLIRVHGTPTWTAANRAAAAEKRTTSFSPRISLLREIILRTVSPCKCSTGFDIVYRWATHWPEIAVLVQRPLAGFSTDLAALFKLPHGIKALRSTVYDHVRVGTDLRIKYIGLRCRRIACKAQYCRSCQAGACQGHQAGACQRHDDHLPPPGYFAWAARVYAWVACSGIGPWLVRGASQRADFHGPRYFCSTETEPAAGQLQLRHEPKLADDCTHSAGCGVGASGAGATRRPRANQRATT